MKELKPRSPLYAVLLSAHIPGLGQMYNGELLFGALLVVTASVGLAGLFRLGILHGIKGLVWGLAIVLTVYLYQSADAWIGASKRFEYFQKKYNHWLYYTVYCLCFFLMCIFAYPLLFQNCNPLAIYKIHSNSMRPALVNGDHVLVDKQAFFKQNPQRWNAIVFASARDPGQTMVKRIVGLPGEVLEIKSRNLFLNGNPAPDLFGHYKSPLPSAGNHRTKESFGPVSIPEGKYFVMGDNRSESIDSRHFGMVDRNCISGKPIFVLFSWDLGRVLLPVP